MLEYIKGIIAMLLKKEEKSAGDDIETEMPVTGVDEGEEDTEGEKVTTRKNYDPEQIIIKFRARPNETGIDVQHDFYHLPTKAEIEEEFGPGLYNIALKEEGDVRPKIKKRWKIEGHPIIPVDSYEIKVRVSVDGKLQDTGVEFPGGRLPTKDDIITAIGGGGFIKINAKKKDGKILWSEWYDYSDIEPPENLKRRDDTFRSKLEQQLDVRKKEIEAEALEQIGVGGGKKGDKFDSAVDKLIDSFEDKKLERLEGAIERFGEKMSNPGTGEKSDGNIGITELAFKVPYQAKLDAQKKIIEETARKNPIEAMKMLDKMPDGITIAMKLALAATGLVEAMSDTFKAQSQTTRTREKENRKPRDEKQNERAKTSVETAIEEKLGCASTIGMEKKVDEKGFAVSFNIGGDKRDANEG